MVRSFRRPIAAAAFAALFAAAIGPAVAQPDPKPDTAKSRDSCFARSEVNGFNAPNDHTVYIRVGVNDIYRLDLMTACMDLSFRQSIGLKSVPAQPFICSPLDAAVVYRQGDVPEECPVSAIHELTPAEAAALPKSDRP